MCPPGYHHNGFMATPELGHRMYAVTHCEELYCIGYHMNGEVISVLSLEGRYYNYNIVTRVI